jgi:hypothetical protein
LWKNVMAVENTQGDAKTRPSTNIEKHRQEQSNQEVEHGGGKTNKQSNGSAPFSAGASEA